MARSGETRPRDARREAFWKGAVAIAGWLSAACAGTDSLEIDEQTAARIRRIWVEGEALAPSGSAPEAAASEESPAESPGATEGGNGASSELDANEVSADAAEASEPEDESSGASPEGSEGEASCDGFAVLAASCANGCHIENNFYGVTAFADDPSRIAALIGAPSASLGDACGPMLDPQDPTGSLIYAKSAGAQGGACGGPMPANTTGLGDEDLECLSAWIGGL